MSPSHPLDSFEIPTITPSEAASTTYEIIIVGSGVLGTALSVSLARSGRKVLVVERDLAPPHSRIVGELLQPGGCLSLDKLGLLDALEGIDAVPCHGYAIFHSTLGQTTTPYPENMNIIQNAQFKDAWNTATLQEGRSFHHGQFVGSLRRYLRNQENLSVLNGTVNDLITLESMGNKVIGIKVTPKGKQAQGSDDNATISSEPIQVYAPLTIVADGYASKFRKFVNPNLPQAITRSHFVGLEIEDCDLPEKYHGHVILPPTTLSSSAIASTSTSPRIGPILLYALSPTTTRMLIDVSSPAGASFKMPSKAYLRDNITPLLPPSIRPSFLAAVADDTPQKIKSMPNSFLPPHIQGGQLAKEGVLLAGDALNMRHPLTGGGMSVALNDCVILTELLGGGKTPIQPTRSIQANGNGHAEVEGNGVHSSIGNGNGHANGHSNGHTNGNGYTNGHANGHTDKPSNGHCNGNGHANGNGVTNISEKQPAAPEPEEAKDSSLYAHSEVCNLEDWWDIRARLEEWHWRRKGVATCVNVLAMALYSLFGADDENLDVLRKGCFRYFLCGGECVRGPVSMLSALNPSPPLLLYHFFSVAFYSIYLVFTDPRPSASGKGKPQAPSLLEYPGLAWQSVLVFWTACVVILPVLWSEVDL